MSEYRYVVFPHGKQPTLGEASELRNYANVLAGKYAIGVSRKTGALAIAFDAAAYDYGMLTHRGFASLIEKWQVRGGKVVQRLAFVKDAKALRPVQSGMWTAGGDDSLDRSTSYGKTIANKELAAKEAVARSALSVQQTIRRYAVLKHFSQSLPYLLAVLAATVTIIVGAYTRSLLRDSNVERRRETTVRVLNDPMNQPLDRQPISMD